MLLLQGDFDDLKIFTKISYPSVKFKEKHDGDGGEPTQLTILELRPNFVQKWSPKQQKAELAKF